MNQDVIEDLKQLIVTTISQQTTELVKRLDKVDARLYKVDARLYKVENKIDSLAVSVAEAIETSNEVTHTQFMDHENRITKLEQKAV